MRPPWLGWLILGVWGGAVVCGQAADPTRPWVNQTENQPGPPGHCVTMTLVGKNRQVAVIDGIRWQAGDVRNGETLLEITAQGVRMTGMGVSQWFDVGQCSFSPLTP